MLRNPLWRHGALLTACFTLTVSAALGQSLGAKYGSREPRTCTSKKDPAKGVLSAEQASRYLVCGIEGEINSNTLYLLENLKVEVGKGTPIRQIAASQRPGTADPDGLVYQIRGSFRRYQCGILYRSGVLANEGKNCSIYEEPKATGSCFRDSFGDWACNMMDLSGPLGNHDQPPPK